jgi:hypothetical protein
LHQSTEVCRSVSIVASSLESQGADVGRIFESFRSRQSTILLISLAEIESSKSYTTIMTYSQCVVTTIVVKLFALLMFHVS